MNLKSSKNLFPNATDSGIPGTEIKSAGTFHQSFFEISLGQWSLHHNLFQNKISNYFLELSNLFCQKKIRHWSSRVRESVFHGQSRK